MSYPIKTVVAFCALAALVVAGCSDSPATSTTTASTTTSKTLEPTVTETVVATATVTVTPDAPKPIDAPFGTYYQADEPDGVDHFKRCGRYAGVATTLTSCKFSIDISAAYRETRSPVLPDFYSRETHEEYDMTCSGGFKVVFYDGTEAAATRCAGGYKAEVLVFE